MSPRSYAGEEEFTSAEWALNCYKEKKSKKSTAVEPSTQIVGAMVEETQLEVEKSPAAASAGEAKSPPSPGAPSVSGVSSASKRTRETLKASLRRFVSQFPEDDLSKKWLEVSGRGREKSVQNAMSSILDEWRKDSRCTTKVATEFSMEQSVEDKSTTKWLTWGELKKKVW